ncbi:MAG: hypothetical protein H6579_00885 [Chitinophagales bacterium]|nr:hypothetical protein [Chitinophagales bacterium]
MKRISLLLIFMFIVSFSCQAEKKDWVYYSFFDQQIFPSYAWSTAQLANDLSTNEAGNFYGDGNAQIGVIFPKLSKGSQVKIVVESSEILTTSTLEFEMAATREMFFAAPQLLYNWTALNSWKQPKPVPIKISVYIDGKFTGEETKNITVRSINDCPFIAVTEFGTIIDMNYVYTAYVNENHPIISNKILPEIMQQNVISKVTGYMGSRDDVYKQVYAVWHYFNSKNFNYSSLSSYFKGDLGDFPNVSAQFVRTFEEVYNTRQANCVEGTILMASILMRMGIDPYLITTPNHCYLGFSVDGSEQNLSYIETTLLGEDLAKQDPKTQELCASVKLTDSDIFMRLSFGKNTYDNFIWALLVGEQNWNDDEARYSADNEGASFQVNETSVFEKYEQLNYQKLSVKKYRKMGLLPLNH